MSENTNTKSTHLAPPEQDIKDDSSDWESPDENEKDKAPDKRSVQKGAKNKAKARALYNNGQRVGLITGRGTERGWQVIQVHSDNTYDLQHELTKVVKQRVAEGKLDG